MQPEQTVPKKKMSALAWIAIGCVGIVVVGAVAVGAGMWWVARKAKALAEDPTAAIELIAAMNPDIEVVDRDAGNGKVTIRNKQTGEVVTVSLEDIQQGKISFSSDQGTSTMDVNQEAGRLEIKTEGENGGTITFGGDTKVPDWVPSYPGAVSQGVYSGETGDSVSGTFSMTTDDSIDEVFTYLKGQLEGGGYKLSETRFSEGGMLSGESADGKQSVTYTFSVTDGKTQVAGMFNQKKG